MLRKTFRAALSLVLVFCLLLGMSANGLVVLANGEQDDTDWRELLAELGKLDSQKDIDYVSLGASNTNGYGIDGYLPEDVYEDPLAASKAGLNVYGYLRAPKAAYPAQIAEALKVKEENFHQLAISSMRTEEVLYLLGEEYNYVNDAYMQWRFTGGQKWFEIAENGGVSALREAYQNYLTNADVITIDLGWNNFGVYAFNNIKTILSDGVYYHAPDFAATSDLITEEDYQEVRASVLASLEKNMDADSEALKDKMGLMLDVLTYATLGAIGHFDSIVEWIYENNPDAKIVVINIQNLADDLVIEFEGTTLKLGDLYGELIDLVNLYRASESPYADKYDFADAGDVETFLDEIIAWNGDPTTLGDNMVDCFDMYDDSLYVRSIVEYMMVGQALSGLFQGFRDTCVTYGLGSVDENGVYTGPFANDDNYTYVFALGLDQSELLSLDLAALNLANPGQHTKDSLLSNGRDKMGDKYEAYNEVEVYGAAVAKHLYNLRHFNEDVDPEADGDQLGKDAYNYVFDSLIEQYKAEMDRYSAINPPSDWVIEGYNAAKQAVETLEGAKAQFAAKLQGVHTTYHNTLNYAYDVVATFMQYAAGINELVVDANSLNGFNQAASSLIGIIANDFIGGATNKFYYELQVNGVVDHDTDPETPAEDTLPSVPEYDLDEGIFENNDALVAIAVLAVRYELGNSFFAHPNEKGHNQITDAVLNALVESDAEDFTNTKMELYMSVLQEKYPNLYAMLMGENNLDDVDDLSIIIQMLKMSGSDIVAGMDLDALEAEIRAELRAFRDSREDPEHAAEAEAACYRLYKKLIDLAAATTAVDYVVNEDSYYVSLGDSTITGYGLDGYVDGAQNGWLQTVSGAAHTLLAKKLFGEEGMKTQFMNYCQGSLRADDLLLFLGGDVELDDYYYEEILPNLEGTLEDTQAKFLEQVQKADLISVAIGGGNFLTFAGKYMNRVLGNTEGEPYELNWERIGVDSTDASMQELQDALDLLVPIVDALGLMDQYLPEGVEIEDPAKFTRALAEGLIYGYASYNYYYTQVLERIREINPDAKLLILGMFNPVDDWKMTTTIDGEETIVNIGGAVANLMESANLQTLAFALQNNNASYIDVSDAETILEAENPGKELGFNDYYNSSFQSNGKAVHASVAGHQYIADQMLAALNGKNTDAEIEAILAELYDVLTNDYLTTQEKLEGIGKAYAALEENVALNDSAAKAVKVIKEIYEVLSEKELITDDHSLAIVINVYEKLLDRELDQADVRAIVKYVYFTVFAVQQPKARIMARASADLGLDLGGFTAGEKLDILENVFDVLENNGYIDNSIPGVTEIVDLYNDIQDDDPEQAVLTDEKIETLISKVVETYVENEVLGEEEIKQLATECVEEVYNDPDIPAEKKVELFNKILETLDEVVGDDISAVIPGAPELPNLTIVTDILENLEAEDLLSHDQASEIIAAILPVVISGEVDAEEVFKTIFDIVYAEGFDAEKTIRITVVIYDTLAEEGLVVSRGDAYDYVMDLVDQIDNILNSNLSGVITDLRGDLNILRGELNEQVNALNLQLQKLTDEEREVLEELLNEREALVEELNALKAQLEAISNGQLTRRSAVASTGELVEELNAAIAETEAKIAALDASIAALNAKIAADLQGVAAIQNAIAEVEQQLNDTLAALAEIAPVVNQLNADLEVLYEASKVLADAISNVTNLTFGKIDVEAVIEAVTTIYEMVPAVIEQMEDLYNETKAAYEYAKAAAASLKPAIDEIRATIETIVNGAEELTGIEGEKLAAIQAAVAECEKAVNGFIADNYDSVEKALTDTYNELMNLAYGEIVKAENLLKENETMILAAAAGAVLALDQAGIIDIENATWGPVAQPYVEMLNGKLEELRDRLETAKQWLKDNYPIAREELDKKIQALRDRLEELELEIPGEYDPEKLEALLAECEELNKLIDAATEMKNKLDAYAQQVLDYIAAVEAAMEEVRTAMDAVIAAGTVVGTDVEALWNELVALGNELEALAETVDTLGREAINELMVIFGYCEVVADDFVALLKTLPAYVEVVEKAVEMATDIEFWLDLAEELKPTVEELAKKLLDLMIQYGKEYAPVIDEALYDYFYNNPEQVIAFFAEYGDEMLALAEEYGDEALGILGVVLYLYGEDMVKYLLENPEDAFANFVAWAEKYGDRVVQMIQVYAEATGLCDIVRGEIGKLEQELEELENELGIQLDLLNDVLLAQLAELRAQLENALEEQRPAIEAAIEELLKQIEDVKTLIAEIQAAIDQIKAMLPELQEKLQALVEALENLDEAMKDLIGDGIETGAALVQKALDEVATAVKELIGVASEELAAQLGELIEQAKEMLDKAYYDATHSEIHIDNDFHYVGIGDDSAVSESYVDLLAKELGISYENLAAAGLSMTDLLYILDENFVADEYTNATFEGDVEALREAYIAALLKADMVTIGVGSFGITDLMYAQAQGALATMLREQLGEWLDWEFGGERPVYDMMSQYVDLSATTYTMDWATYLGEEGVAKLAELLADVRADLIEKGIPETYTYDVGLIVNGVLDTPIDIFGAGEIVVTIPVADLLTMMVESYMYAYVTHLFNAGEVFNLIHEINPEAELLVVGMFNPMDEIVLNLAGTTIALGDYYDYLVDVMNLRYLGYAFVAPNTTFVAIPDAQSTIDIAVEQFENIDEMLMALALGEIESNVDMTEAGQIYVKDQILNALVITKGILGDANEDGRVSSVDAMLALQYAAKQDVDVNEVLADVNGDGRISAVDAMLILQYAAKAIDEFPAEQ